MRSAAALACALTATTLGCEADRVLPWFPVDATELSGPTTTIQFHPTQRTKVDLLVMIDNSNSMDSMQAALQKRFPQLFQPFRDLAQQGIYADLHVGVVTSDYGAGATGSPGCTPSGLAGGGDQGKLIARGKKAAANCQKPTDGDNYIRYTFGADGAVESNLPEGQDLVQTFTCMSSVGAQGCGFEHQLESVYAALSGNVPENRGFLRSDALLLVVFLTNEDDASAPPDSDIFDKNQVAKYGYEDSYSRQTRFAVMCGRPAEFPPYGPSYGPLADCVPAPNRGGAGPGKQYDVQQYIDFFTHRPSEGGLKDDPLDVVLVGIDGPETPFEVILSNPGTPAGQPFLPCPAFNESANPPCVPVLQHSCINAKDPNFFGDPAVRINAVIRATPNHALASICDDDYTPPLRYAGQFLIGAIGPGCIAAPLPRSAAGKPIISCNVDLTEPGQPLRTIPACDEGDGNAPCWKVEPKSLCQGLSPDGLGVTIVAGFGRMWDGARATCVTK